MRLQHYELSRAIGLIPIERHVAVHYVFRETHRLQLLQHLVVDEGKGGDLSFMDLEINLAGEWFTLG